MMKLCAALLGTLVGIFGAGSPIAAQQLEIQTVSVNRLTGAKGLIAVGDAVLVETVEDMVVQPAVLVRVRSEAANVEVDVTDNERRRVEFEKVASKGSETVYLISTPGRFWVDVTVIDFAKNIYSRDWEVVEVKEGAPIGPAPVPVAEPNATLKALVQPVTAKLQGNPERAAELRSAFLGFSEAVKVLLPKNVQQFARVNDAALRVLAIPAGDPVGADVAKVFESYVGFETNEAKQWKDRPLTAVDQAKIIEAYQALSWAAR